MPLNNPYANVPEAPKELDFESLAQKQQIELEIGFGRGHFILDRAELDKHIFIIGLETRRKWVGLVTARAQRRQLLNVELYFGDARQLIQNWGPNESLSAVYIHFPDPWWKKRHHKRRVMCPETIHHVARLLKPGGYFFIQTDVEERAELFRSLLEQEPTLKETIGNKESPLDHNPVGIQTHREKKCTQANLPIYRFYFEKLGTPIQPSVLLQKRE